MVGGKKHITVTDVEPVGQYAIKLSFDDGHDSGLYTWQTLYELGRDYTDNWATYLKRLETAGLKRSADASVEIFHPSTNSKS